MKPTTIACVCVAVLGGALLALKPRLHSEPTVRADSVGARVIGHSGTRVAGWTSTSASLPQVSVPNGTDSVSDGDRVRVVVRSFQNVTIGSELNARILAMGLRDGDRFKKGDALVRFDCERTEAELAAAEAVHEGHKLVHAQNMQLLKYKAGGATAVELAKFEMMKSEADVRSLRAKRATCTVLAPFDGRVVEKLAQAFEVATPNQPLLKIVDDSSLELVLMVPSNWVGRVRLGTGFELRVDETGQAHRAVVSQIGGAIDPVSQTVRLIGTIEAPSALVLPGMSGTANFSTAGDQP